MTRRRPKYVPSDASGRFIVRGGYWVKLNGKEAWRKPRRIPALRLFKKPPPELPPLDPDKLKTIWRTPWVIELPYDPRQKGAEFPLPPSPPPVQQSRWMKPDLTTALGQARCMLLQGWAEDNQAMIDQAELLLRQMVKEMKDDQRAGEASASAGHGDGAYGGAGK